MKPGERKNKQSHRPGRGKPERYVQPSLLMALRDREAYGYELIKIIGEYGFVPGDVPPGMIYRHLRQMEEEGLLASTWQTDEAGPAKRVYHITQGGHDSLAAWIGHMENIAAKLTRFIADYRRPDAPQGPTRDD